jgi:hypothetical protein
MTVFKYVYCHGTIGDAGREQRSLPASTCLSHSRFKAQEFLPSFLVVIPSRKVENHLVHVMAQTFSSCNMHKIVVEKHGQNSLCLYVSTQVAYSGHVWRTRCESESVAARKLVQSKAQEEGSAMACGRTVVDKSKLTSRSCVANDSEIITVLCMML